LGESPYITEIAGACTGAAEEEVMDDILNFKDSERDSLLSYIQSAAVLIPEPLQIPMIDTPTRLVNESNEFLEMHLVKKRKASLVTTNHQKIDRNDKT